MTDSPDKIPSILTIDDEASIRQSFRAFLEDLDYQVHEAECGISGIKSFRANKPDLVLVDLNMPDIDGLEVLEKLKDYIAETPFIVISGTGRLSDIAQALRLGAWDYLFKPIKDLTVLEHAINKALERANLLMEKKQYQQQLEREVMLRTTELQQSERKYRHIFENLHDIYFESTLEGKLLEMSPSVVDSTQYTREELLEQNVLTYYLVESQRKEFLKLLVTNGKVNHYEVLFKDKDGTVLPFSMSASIIQDEDEQEFKIVGSLQNIAARKAAEDALIESEKQYRSLVSNMPVGLYRYNLDRGGGYITANPAMANILGYDSVDELMKTHPNDLYLTEADQEQVMNLLLVQEKVLSTEIPVKKKDGTAIWTAITAFVFKNKHGIIKYIDTMIQDISLRKKAEERIKHLSYYDFLTELPNRTMFLYRLKQAIASSRRNKLYGGAIIIDLDRFKAINDSLGHQLGDTFLQQVAKRLLVQTRDEDTVARIGGDEFAIIFTELSQSVEDAGRFVQNIAEKIRQELTYPFHIDGQELYVTASIGIAMFPDHTEDAEAVLKHATTAVNRLKEGERNACLFYLPDMQKAANKRLMLEKELRLALANNDFELYYQPQTNFSGKVIGAETLVRWIHPEKGLISPGDFIPVAEETGLIISLGEWIINQACKQIRSWLEKELMFDMKYVSVNVSPRQFRQENFTDMVAAAIDETRIPPSLLSIEITESVAIDDLDDTINKMNHLRKKGISISIDDFGTGYSALSYLNRLPINQLKIDRSFVTGLTEESGFASIVSTIIVMARSMGFSVVAEGVETVDELNFLYEKECRIFQGFYFSPPMPWKNFQNLLEKSRNQEQSVRE